MKNENKVIKLSLFIPVLLIVCIIFPCTISPVFAVPNNQAYQANVDSTRSIDKEQAIENVRTFAKLYGYIKYFHPSDAASSIDWDRFAIYGVRVVKNSDNKKKLRDNLRELFQPIAPTVQIYSSIKQPPVPANILTPSDTTDLKLIAWQHKGFGFGEYDYYKSIRLNRPVKNPAKPLFEERPKAGEVVEKTLDRGLAAQIPLALYSKNGQTLESSDTTSLNNLKEQLQSIPIDSLTGADEALRYADVVIAWNVFQHFYPYFDVVNVNWDNVLTKALVKASNDLKPEDFLKTLKWMVVQLKDGHGIVRLQDINDFVRFPFVIREIEGQLMITATSINAEKDACFKQGDIITSINGESADQWFDRERKLASGTSQWKTAFSLSQLNYGPPGEQFKFVLNRPGESVRCTITRSKDTDFQLKEPGPIEEIREDIYYVDLSSASMDVINKKADTLASAKGLIFDQRGYPNRNHGVLQYLSKDTLRSARWMIPQIIYPDQANVAGFDTSGRWTLPPKKPYFSGKKIFLMSKNTISYGESVMGIVEHYDFAEIVGETSAGANGTVSSFVLPGGYNINFTGMKVVKHDYSQHHLVGIKPTVPVERTMEGVRKGKDEYLEKALELIEESNNR
jgi:C-terminal processing protease CtpA/Prc